MTYNYYQSADELELDYDTPRAWGPLLPGAEWDAYAAPEEWGDPLLEDAADLGGVVIAAPAAVGLWRNVAAWVAVALLAVVGSALMTVRPALGVVDEVVFWLIAVQVAVIMVSGMRRVARRG